MKKVLLINQNEIPHYRIDVYNYLHAYLKEVDYKLYIVSGGLQSDFSRSINFDLKIIKLKFLKICEYIISINPDIIILWVNLKNIYLFPTIAFSKILNKKLIYWGHGRDLLDLNAKIKNLIYAFEHMTCDAIILYASHLKKYIPKRFHKKIFIANNTLNFTMYENINIDKNNILKKYGIKTKKNIICIGRMQKRKRLDNLYNAFKGINKEDCGLIFVGPDTDNIVKNYIKKNIYNLGPMYGKDKIEIMSASDIFCIPGAIGLSVVDALYCGLPIVTEEGDESPEISYLKNGINGFFVGKNNIEELKEKLMILMEDDKLRYKLSCFSKLEYEKSANINLMAKGFINVQ